MPHHCYCFVETLFSAGFGPPPHWLLSSEKPRPSLFLGMPARQEPSRRGERRRGRLPVEGHWELLPARRREQEERDREERDRRLGVREGSHLPASPQPAPVTAFGRCSCCWPGRDREALSWPRPATVTGQETERGVLLSPPPTGIALQPALTAWSSSSLDNSLVTSHQPPTIE